MRTDGSQVLEVLHEVRDGWRWRELWTTLGWREVMTRHQRSNIGPFWNTIGLAFVAICIGGLYGGILERPHSEYIPHLVAGYMIWTFLASLVIEGKDAFVSNAAAIREIAVPGTVYVYKLIWKNLIILAFNALVYLGVMVLYQKSPFPSIVLVLPALAIVLLNAIWVGLLLGLINVRHRDFGNFIPNAMRLGFFVTPILWYPDAVSGLRAIFVHLNPFYYFVELVRAPLLGQVPTSLIWAVAIGITVIGWGITLPIYAHWRRRIAFWV
ncbi:ABC transporter permease [Microvirga lotononidis]|uniref:ABC-type polysaccharide/polyol phosphate export system, permease component n=1 Tax=Microvirga lotononidis TaxID=864069 RepID=I4YQC1_9HYPH|nr:ABC transporter permease [Microvirga lotononidis]EIM26163.1 ABC-type polysaccharide/polyol phosphate export system, permease component [Microvirga lotononidis]WQO26065.1 ABC transporter permease [Microvirga lotononidis]